MRRRTARYDDDSDSLDGVGRDYDRMGLAEFAANDPYDSREPYDGGGRPNVSPERSSRRYDSIGRYVLSRNRLPRRRRIWRDNRPTRGPRWMREPVDLQTAATWHRNTREQQGRAATWARKFLAQLEREERGRPPSLRLRRARSLKPTNLRRVVSDGRCRELCGAVRDTGSPYCSTCRPARVAWLHRLREARRRARNCRKKPTEPR